MLDKNVENTVSALQNAIGEKNMEKLLGNRESIEKMASNLNPQQLEAINGLIKNPEMLKMFLSNPKTIEGLKNFLK